MVDDYEALTAKSNALSFAYCKRLAARIAESPDVFDADRRCRDLLEPEIERRGWDAQKRYIEALQKITECIPFDDVGYYWPLIRATPEQRARAFLAVMEAH
jgi:hypothetical protein